MDILPNIKLGPVRNREHANRFALADFSVVKTPQFGTLVLRIPTMVFITERVDALFGTRFFFIATTATERSIETIFIKRLLKTFCLHHVGVLAAGLQRIKIQCSAFFIDVSDHV